MWEMEDAPEVVSEHAGNASLLDAIRPFAALIPFGADVSHGDLVCRVMKVSAEVEPKQVVKVMVVL